MMFKELTTNTIKGLVTPAYYYDLDILNKTLGAVKNASGKYGYEVHYAVKANSNRRIMEVVSSYGFGADCVSGNEITRALETGFNTDGIVYAGVGKRDDEIKLALKKGIFSINIESLPELEIINSIAKEMKLRARVALRINPNVDAFTHKYITTGIEETKFGINLWDLESLEEILSANSYLDVTGLHFHIGSQILRPTAFKTLCSRINELQPWFEDRGIKPTHINVGGGLGIDYSDPEQLPDFDEFFALFDELLELRPGQKLHFELGRSMVGQAGALLTRVLYVKNGVKTKFAIVDAGMTDLIRPALYQSYHKIENLTSKGKNERYNVVGPICESTDCFAKYIELPETKRGDLLAIRSAGAYGEVMVSSYNLKDPPKVVFSDELQ